MPQFSPAMIEWCGPGNRDDVPGLHGREDACGRVGFDAEYQEAAGGRYRLAVPFRGGAEHADAQRNDDDVDRVPRSQLLVEFGEDRRVALDHPSGRVLVPGPRGVRHDEVDG